MSRFFVHRSLFALCLLAMLLLAGCSSMPDTSRTFRTVVIDPGHGGIDSGALGRKGLREKTLTLDVAQRLDRKLKAEGFRTVLTRNTDRFVPLGTRAAIANQPHNAIFLSIHFNQTGSSAAHGAETFFFRPFSKSLAVNVQNAVAPDGGRGVKVAHYHVLRNTRMPAVLVECCFLSNSADANRAASPEFREQLADRLYNGLMRQRGSSLKSSQP